MSPSEPQTRPISHWQPRRQGVSRPAPPSSKAGLSQPISDAPGQSRSGSAARARARRRPARPRVTMKSRIVSRRSWCSGERSRISPEPTRRQYLAPVLACRHVRAPRVGRRGPSILAAADRRGQRPLEPAPRSPAPPPDRWPELTRPAGDAPRREPDRRPPAAPGAREAPAWSAARPSATASAARDTSTTSRPMPRASSRRTTTGWPAGLLAAIEAIGGDDLLEQVFAARRRQLGARVREDIADRLTDDAPLLDRVRELAVIQAANGYLADANVGSDGTIRLQEHNCAIYHVALARRPPARPSSNCSPRSSAPTSCASSTSRRATAAARIESPSAED